MSVVPAKPVHHSDRKILGPGGNRAVRVPATKPKETADKIALSSPSNPVHEGPQRRSNNRSSQKKPAAAAVAPKPESKVDSDVGMNASVESSCSSSSSSSLSNGKRENGLKRREKARGGTKTAPVVVPAAVTAPIRRCEWITANSDPFYITFHDKEWGVPVHDDGKLFELFVLSIALAEHTWTSIISNRDMFRKLFDDFNPACVSNFSEEKLLSLITHSRPLLSEAKLRAVVDNAKLVIKIQEQFGSFSNYCWTFVNHKPVRSGFRNQRQVPLKTAKSELISRDLMRRGFRCVGPTVVYSFMQVSGMVNDHLVTCFRYEHCNACVNACIK